MDDYWKVKRVKKLSTNEPIGLRPMKLKPFAHREINQPSRRRSSISVNSVASAIKNAAFRFNIKHEKRFWTDEMIQILKDKYPEFGSEISELKELGKTNNAIIERARLLGIKCKYHKNQFGNFEKNFKEVKEKNA